MRLLSHLMRALPISCALLILAPAAHSQNASQTAAPTTKPAAQAQRPAVAPSLRPVRSVEGISEYRLPNGLQVLLYPDDAKPTATVNITYLVGSRQESYGETGMAHLLEHMIFKGSRNFPNPDKEFSARGFRNNGSTSFDRTNYFSTFQASDDNLRWAIAWSADAMVNSFIAEKDLKSEMTVVRNEYETGESRPDQVLFKRMFAVMYDWHNYGNLPIGNRSDIENVPIANLQAFYRRYYQPDNAVLTIAGKFDPDKTLRVVAETFGRIPKPTRTLPVFWTVEPPKDGERSFVVRRPGNIQFVVVGYHVPSALSRDIDAVNAAVDILGNAPNGRLHRELVEKGLAAQVFSQMMSLRDPGVAMFGAVVKPGEPLEPVRDKIVEIVEQAFAKEAPTDAELTRYKQEADTYFERVLADPQEFGVGLSEYIALGDWRLFFLARERAAQQTSSSVAQAAAAYFRRDNRTVGMFIPEEQPQRAQIGLPLPPQELLKDFKARASADAGEVFEPTQDNINKRTRIVRFGDLNVALLPKKTRGQTVNVAMNFRFGDEKNLQGQSIARLLTASMFGRGTDKLTRQQIADERTRLKMTGGVLQFQASRDTLAEALKLTAHVLRDANFPANEFDLLKRELVTGLQAQLSEPGARSSDALNAHFNIYPAGDPRYYMPLAERIERIQAAKREELVQFHRQYWGTARGDIAIVGDFDDKAVERLLRELFTGWVSKVPYARVLSDAREVPATRAVINTPEKENAFFRARLNIAMRDDDPDYPALLLANTIIGGGSGLSNRLIDRLRQKDGLSYGAGSGLNVGPIDRAAFWAMAATAAPQNMLKLEAAAKEELVRLLKEGFNAKEVEAARAGLLQERVLARSEDSTLASAWTSNLFVGRDFTFSKELEAKLRALSVEDLNRAVRKYLDPKQLTVVIAGDAAKGIK